VTSPASWSPAAALGAARAGVLSLPHGDVPTPAFMPVGTRGTVRGVDPAELRALGTSIVLANTYHLWERPGHTRIAALGGLHAFMGWDGPILTDSGGYQVFSLGHRALLDESGVRFRSPYDGEQRELTPELAIGIQEDLGVDVAMVLDVLVAADAPRPEVEAALDRTTRWLRRSLEARTRPDRTAVFGIVQGGLHADLRTAHADALAAMDLDGYAIGGLSVGEGHEAMMATLDVTMPRLPGGKVRYLMGVGHPEDIVEAVVRGVDLFDCVLPTRMGRHGQVYTWDGRMNLKNARFLDDPSPLDPTSPGSPANRFSRAYLAHLVRCDEQLGARLLSLHNLWFYQELMARLRCVIAAGDGAGLEALRAEARRATRAPPDAVAPPGPDE
jgi:queuine tRNA-ribosyltransferase